jgi:hypothetical protein
MPGLGFLCSDRAILAHESLTLEPNISQNVSLMLLHCFHSFFHCRFQKAHTVRNANTAITQFTETSL